MNILVKTNMLIKHTRYIPSSSLKITIFKGVMFICLSCLLLFSVIGFELHAQNYPGITPDCWTQNRAVHIEGEEYVIADYLQISKVPNAIEKRDQVSPNNGYSLSWENSRTQKDKPYSHITIYSEKEYLTELKFDNHYALNQIKWVNENLIFFRVYLGRIIFIDVIFNVEKEVIIWEQAAMDNHNLIDQWLSYCNENNNCKCSKEQ